MICGLFYRWLRIKKRRMEGFEDKKNFLDVLANEINQYKDNTVDAAYFDMKQSVKLTDQDKDRLESHIKIKKSEKKYIRRLYSLNTLKRADASVVLGLLGTETARAALEYAIIRERNFPVRLYMANALSDIGSSESIPVLVASLLNSHRWYRDKVNMLLADYGKELDSFLPLIYERNRLEMVELIVDFSSVYHTDRLKKYLLHIIDHRQDEIQQLERLYGSSDHPCCANCINYVADHRGTGRKCKLIGDVKEDYRCRRYKRLPISVNAASNYNRLVIKAAEVLAEFYPKALDHNKYLNSEDNQIRNIAVKALAGFEAKDNLRRLLVLIKDDDIARSAVYSISRILEAAPEYMGVVIKVFTEEENTGNKKLIAQILSGRIEFFIMRLLNPNPGVAADILKQLFLLGRTSEVIDFLNKNKDIDLENEILAIIKEILPSCEALKKELSIYLEERLCRKCGLDHAIKVPQKKEEKKDKKLTLQLWILLLATLMLSPAIYAIRRFDILFTTSFIEQLKIFIVDFNYYLAYYSIAVNAIYIALLILSFFQVNQQSKRWGLKRITMLFKKRIMPTASIIAPAFNEEMTIIESANSLLNLKYPDYELIIVNDGSSDQTMERLIRYFDLVRVDFEYQDKLKTKSIRGVYINRSMPKLIVVDKENGGKADSLNAGINISTKDYFCCIDADSLLERDALLKLASLTLDQGIETPALGGNIFPVNGCIVERGEIKKINIPSNKIARFQNIEYIRAFMAGRLGWASLNSLLIISGAFGLFRKDRIVSIGGYLTSSGKYEKDTVGEDMELVVRISRLMRELGKRYQICYAYNANCWTEVPEDLKSLKRQRYRWHRGLIDIITFHKKMLFNPRYGRTGMLALPYYFIFEMIGPILEIEGYLMVVAAFILGLLNAEIALLLFISTVLMGVFISISALMIAEKDTSYYKFKDLLILLLYAIVENFGPRQIFSFWRVSGFLKMFGNQSGWGKATRKGFGNSDRKEKV
jgi:cellulose synthase/poly-beta-1,6-N-acetylglucosamine synthase-like glycosyltransferase